MDHAVLNILSFTVILFKYYSETITYTMFSSIFPNMKYENEWNVPCTNYRKSSILLEQFVFSLKNLLFLIICVEVIAGSCFQYVVFKLLQFSRSAWIWDKEIKHVASYYV